MGTDRKTVLCTQIVQEIEAPIEALLGRARSEFCWHSTHADKSSEM
jgi:hypothetical protein